MNEKVSRLQRVDLDKNLGEKISELLILWANLITFDRRQKYESLEIDEERAKALNFIGTAFIMNEAYLSNTTSWVLPKPLLIDQEGLYNFYIGTQLGNAGTTIICENCESAIKYYWPAEEGVDSKKIQTILSASICPLCGEIIKESEDSEIFRGIMTKIMAKFKYEIGQALE